MKEQEESRGLEEKGESIQTMDQGLNLIVQIVNNMTGLDKSNDGIPKNND